MRKILIASHSMLADGMKKTLEFLTSMNNVYSISAYVNDTPLIDQIEEFKKLLNKDDELVILTDMQGGSVNQAFCFLMNEHTHLICGVNLSLALAIALYPGDERLSSDKIESIVESAQCQIKYMNSFSLENDEEDE
ncbi:MAG: PTS sugar transporter subunit IIA [Breznakia sp.]